MKNKILLLFSFIIFAFNLSAQETYIFNNNRNNYSLVNPAASGLLYKHFATVCGNNSYRNSNSDIKSLYAIYDFDFSKINSGIGINYIYDTISINEYNKLNVNYSYHLKLKNERKLSVGLSLGLQKVKTDYKNVRYVNFGNSPYFYGIEEEYFLNYNFGLMYKSPKILAGFSVNKYSNNNNYERPFQYYFTGLYNINISKNFEAEPGLDIALHEGLYDINLILKYKKNIWIGSTCRNLDNFIFMGGADIKGKYRIGYSYHKNIIHSSHEILLAFLIK